MIIRTLDGPWDPGPLDDRLNHDCVFLFGIPMCWGACAVGDHACTCRHLTAAQHWQAERDAHTQAKRRHGHMCKDCLFRSKDLEDLYERNELAKSAGPHYCHVMVPLHALGGVPQRDSFAPRAEEFYPVCAGWRAARRREFKKGLRLVPPPDLRCAVCRAKPRPDTCPRCFGTGLEP